MDRSNPVYQGRPGTAIGEMLGHVLVVASELGIPPEAAPVVLAEFDRELRFTLTPAIRAIGVLGARGAPAVPKLVAILEGKRRSQPILVFLERTNPHLESIRTLGRLGPLARDAIPVLKKIAEQDPKHLSDEGSVEVEAARRALEEIQG